MFSEFIARSTHRSVECKDLDTAISFMMSSWRKTKETSAYFTGAVYRKMPPALPAHTLVNDEMYKTYASALYARFGVAAKKEYFLHLDSGTMRINCPMLMAPVPTLQEAEILFDHIVRVNNADEEVALYRIDQFWHLPPLGLKGVEKIAEIFGQY
jgi:hypothetical protein